MRGIQYVSEVNRNCVKMLFCVLFLIKSIYYVFSECRGQKTTSRITSQIHANSQLEGLSDCWLSLVANGKFTELIQKVYL